ncbi:unnamed protein product [Caenorhabditis angaria]|uniref:G-protein coupled receptors family 1 profile domain-containing protein n=1 Tax=Caenorhabditis angaria TaxID=860376 RepID=A0A9P1NA10_9PELO|nr:unnamed protein product [Caenorhabditis angaria]
MSRYFLAAIICIMIIMTTVGNALVCLAVLLVRKLKHPQNFLLVSLAVADFFVGLLVMPLALVDLIFDNWPLGSYLCHFYTTSDLTLCTASIVNLCAISVDRYLVISRPLRYSAQRTSKRILTYIAVVWLIAGIVGFSSRVIASILSTDEESSTRCEVLQYSWYQIYATIISFYGPTFIMIILNIKIWRAAKRLAAQDRLMSHCNSIDNNTNEHKSRNSSSPENTDLLNECSKKERTNSTNSRLFKLEKKYLHRPSALFTTTPKGPLIRQSERSESIVKAIFGYTISNSLNLLILWLGYSNSTLNPLIYCKYNKEFRIPFREMLACRCSTLQTVMRQQSFTSRYGPPVRYSNQSSSYRPLLSRRNDSQNEASDV